MVDLVAADWTGVEDPHNPGMDFPTAWAIQREVGADLEHDSRCSFVQAEMLCDCGAIRAEWRRRRTPESEEGGDNG